MKNTIGYLFILLLVTACGQTSPSKASRTSAKVIVQTDSIKLNSFQQILDSAELYGSILVFDEQLKSFYSNDFNWSAKGALPASTFKIPNSLILLENGVVKNLGQKSIWDGTPRSFKMWEADLTFEQAFKKSCLPCYQELTRELGEERMASSLNKIEYPGMEFSSNDYDQFWVVGESKISQFEQIAFLRWIANGKIAVRDESLECLKEIMLQDYEGGVLRGKTGWTRKDGKEIGWYVGWLEKAERRFFFATRIEPNMNFKMKNFVPIRKEVTLIALGELTN